MRRFTLHRSEDASGISGIGDVAEGVQFEDGVVVLHWRGSVRSTAIYRSMAEVVTVHGHEGRTWPEFFED